MEKSVCKINNNKGAINTGFFCIIPLIKEKKYLPVLITNKHILDEEDLLPGKKIYCRMNDDKLDFSINMDKTRKIFFDEWYDYTIIEIKPQDDKLNFIEFLEIDDTFLLKDFDPALYKDCNIYLILYNFGERVGYSPGKLLRISNGYDLLYFAETDLGSGGSPILNLHNFKVLGIHQGKKKQCLIPVVELI